jgi:leader peptidase (prepilin peptidase)/N-methyltransferase
LAFGSFLNVCVYRIPLALPNEEHGESALRSLIKGLGAWRAVNVPARSFCPVCRGAIAWYDNIPVLSWIWLRGRCRHCRTAIRFRYVAVELLTALSFLISYANFGATLAAAKFCVFCFLLIGLAFMDSEHRLLPDAFTVPGLVLGLGFSLVVPVQDIAGRYLFRTLPLGDWRLFSFADSAAGAVAAAGLVFGAGALYRLVRGQEGMGLGDVKMMGFVGAFLGLTLSLLTIFLGSVLGSLAGVGLLLRVWHKRWLRRVRSGDPALTACRRAWISAKFVRYFAMPFGTFLSAGALLATFTGRALLAWYLRFWL